MFFFKPRDYELFLKKYRIYINDYADTFAYALLPTHYHIVVRPKEENPAGIFVNQLRKFIISYTNIINKDYFRNGSLFLKKFKRKVIRDEDYLRHLVYYIHINPVKHKVTDDYLTYRYSSYLALISDAKTNLNRSELINYFGSRDDFIAFHEIKHDESKLGGLTFED
ncbi:MAG: hypothetical protein K9G47_07020 [Bacteroidales bacterium]|nr:hypothetical protein [Bacteroidales bacterium]